MLNLAWFFVRIFSATCWIDTWLSSKNYFVIFNGVLPVEESRLVFFESAKPWTYRYQVREFVHINCERIIARLSIQVFYIRLRSLGFRSFLYDFIFFQISFKFSCKFSAKIRNQIGWEFIIAFSIFRKSQIVCKYFFNTRLFPYTIYKKGKKNFTIFFSKKRRIL